MTGNYHIYVYMVSCMFSLGVWLDGDIVEGHYHRSCQGMLLQGCLLGPQAP